MYLLEPQSVTELSEWNQAINEHLLPDQWRKLDLSGKEILRLPLNINQFIQLNDLTLTNNKLTHIQIDSRLCS